MSITPSSGSSNASATMAAEAPQKVVFDDPHASAAGLNEAEVTRVRTLQGGWRWLLVAATALTIFLCINQQFSLRFFVGYTQLNTEYFYLLIALMLPFTFLIFPGFERSPLDRIPWYDILLFVLTFGSSIVLMNTVRKAAEEATEAKSTYIARVSHEIRTPMNAILGLTHLLSQEISAPKPREQLAKIQQAARHLLQIINDVLDLSTIESEQLTLEKVEFSPVQIIHHAIGLLSERVTAKGLQLALAIPPYAP